MMPTSAARTNNFDSLRLMAAMFVLIYHSYALTGAAGPDPFYKYLGGYDSGGGIGVAIFFVISGYLVSGSAARHTTLNYIASRALRILPALIAVSVFDVFVIGPLFTSMSLPDYFSSPQTWDHLANPMIFGLTGSLPGTFTNHVVPAVNGSLWTLPIECGFYLLLPVIGFCGALTRIGSLAVLGACLIAYAIAVTWFGLDWAHPGATVIRGVSVFYGLRYAVFFSAGSALWLWRDWIAPNTGGALIAGALLVAASQCFAAPLAYFLCLPYLVIYAAVSLPHLPLGEKIGDLSYGTYLFAFPIQQAVLSALGPATGPNTLSLVAIPITLLLASASWRWIENPALQLRNRPLNFRAARQATGWKTDKLREDPESPDELASRTDVRRKGMST